LSTALFNLIERPLGCREFPDPDQCPSASYQGVVYSELQPTRASLSDQFFRVLQCAVVASGHEHHIAENVKAIRYKEGIANVWNQPGRKLTLLDSCVSVSLEVHHGQAVGRKQPECMVRPIIAMPS
jgi:hypothetical protein